MTISRKTKELIFLGKRCSDEKYNSCLECYTKDFLTNTGECFPEFTPELNITQSMYREDLLKARIRFSEALNSSINFSNIQTELFASTEKTQLISSIVESMVLENNSFTLAIFIKPDVSEINNGVLLVHFKNQTDIRGSSNSKKVLRKTSRWLRIRLL